MLNVHNASVNFAGRDATPVKALDRVSLEIPVGGIVVALGASGCGKSTLLNAIAGFLPLSDGSITLEGKSVAGPGADRGVVFQKDTLLPWRSVVDNVALGLDFAGLPRAEAGKKGWSCCGSSACRTSRGPSPTSCPAACVSASTSRALW